MCKTIQYIFIAWNILSLGCSVSQYRRQLILSQYVDLSVKVNYTILDGPGQHLMNNIFSGKTIAVQTFQTQFVQDIAAALNISTSRVLVNDLKPLNTSWQDIMPGAAHSSWRAENVICTFRLIESETGTNDLIGLVKTLGQLIELQGDKRNVWKAWSKGGVMNAVDSYWGLVALNWDASLRLWYNIFVVGGTQVRQNRYIDLGLYNACEHAAYFNTTYCDFERMFEQDVRTALELQPGQVDIEFVKAASADQVYVFFRLLPSASGSVPIYSFVPNSPPNSSVRTDATGVAAAMEELHRQVLNLSSPLYAGNVTVRTDSAWGVSGNRPSPRSRSPYLGYRIYNPQDQDAEFRCKATHRCNMAYTQYNQSQRTVGYTYKTFYNGLPLNASLFSNFEAWQQGSLGWSYGGYDPLLGGPSSTGSPYLKLHPQRNITVRGAHFSPFSFTSLGPVVETFDMGGNGQQNRGLVLNWQTKQQQMIDQTNYVKSIQAYIDWLQKNKEITFQDAATRARINSKRKTQLEINSQQARLQLETKRLQMLNASQCKFLNGSETQYDLLHKVNCSLCFEQAMVNPLFLANHPNCSLCGRQDCSLLFNTSSLEMVGTINATGYLVKTWNGTEVALFSFDSIELGPEVQVTLVGQRALVLMSRSSVVINTTFLALPGEISGFPGGYSVARTLEDRLILPQDRFICNLLNTSMQLTSNNINGPGSGNVRVYLFTVTTSATDVDEIQIITTSAQHGQQLSGGFYIHYNDTYNTVLIPHNATASELKAHIEVGLNLVDPSASQNAQIRRTAGYPGVGIVNVTRSPADPQGGYTWTIYFTSAIGNIPQLTVTSLLAGLKADVQVQTLQDGDSVGGFFSLTFLNGYTRQVPSDILANDLENILEEDIDLLLSARVWRTDSGIQCWDGLCYDGPTPGGGRTWTLVLTTSIGNISPTSPTGALATQVGAVEMMTANGSLLTGQGVQIVVNQSLALSDRQYDSLLSLKIPFSLAFGGGGAGNGGRGGKGARTKNSAGERYNTAVIADLLGGSGGQMGDMDIPSIHQHAKPTGRGGAGGGAIEIVAMNDIVIGTKGQLLVDAEDGYPGLVFGGGGGSGGSILLAAGGFVRLEGVLSANGGDGGQSTASQGFSGGGGGGGRVAVVAQSFTMEPTGVVQVSGGDCFLTLEHAVTNNCSRGGEQGTFFVDTLFDGLEFEIDWKTGAAESGRSLHVKNYQNITTPSGVVRPQWFGRKGPEYTFSQPRFPGRVTFYVKWNAFGGVSHVSRRNNWGAMFSLNGKLDSITRNSSILIGIGFSDVITFGKNIFYTADEQFYDKVFDQAEPHAQMNRWYYIDMHINWAVGTFDLYIDNVLRVDQGEFNIESGLFGIGLYATPGNEVWFDEIYVGDEQTSPLMGFRCPTVTPFGVKAENLPPKFGWEAEDFGPFTSRAHMQRHSQHVAQRKVYGFSNGGILPFDGDGDVVFQSDVKSRQSVRQPGGQPGYLHAGALLYVKGNEVPEDLRESSTTSSGGQTKFWSGDQMNGASGGRYYWYGEHQYESGVSYLLGGVHACSTNDFITWRDEGTMLHFINISDLVHNSSGPFVASQPKVLYNNMTNQYVMWMNIDNTNGTLGLAGVAISDTPNGPFHFVRSFYPDGNTTYDQTVITDDHGVGFLARTYYNNIEYVLPEPLMMPIWESPRAENGSILFGLNFHRAFYEPENDNYHDIYMQRWRNEDIPWQVVCVNKITGANRTVNTLTGRKADGSYCTSPDEYKITVGQGQPAVASRFKDPTDPEFNKWVPSSVPGVKAQTWYYNYLDGSCGIRKLNDDYDREDPDIQFKLNLTYNFEDRSSCSNIADNPLHNNLPDKLIGIQTIVQTRRTKFVAISRLTEDFLDTSGVLTSFEGELEGNTQLISLLMQYGQFGLSSGSTLQSTFQPQVYGPFKMENDWNSRFHQYESYPNDRAFFSLACVLDGSCAVNFKQHLDD